MPTPPDATLTPGSPGKGSSRSNRSKLRNPNFSDTIITRATLTETRDKPRPLWKRAALWVGKRLAVTAVIGGGLYLAVDHYLVEPVVSSIKTTGKINTGELEWGNKPGAEPNGKGIVRPVDPDQEFRDRQGDAARQRLLLQSEEKQKPQP